MAIAAALREIINPKDNTKILTPLSDDAAFKILNELKGNTFAQSLYGQWKDRGLSKGQMFWAHKLALDEHNRRKPKDLFDRSAKDDPNKVDLGHDVFNVLSGMFSKAADQIQYPKIRFAHGELQIKMTVAGDRAKVPGSINVVDLNDRDTWYGRIVKGDVFEKGSRCTAAVVEFLKKFAADPVGEAEAYGKLTGMCCFCHKELSHQSSMNRGYGPVCAERWGLEHHYEDITRPDTIVEVSKS